MCLIWEISFGVRRLAQCPVNKELVCSPREYHDCYGTMTRLYRDQPLPSVFLLSSPAFRLFCSMWPFINPFHHLIFSQSASSTLSTLRCCFYQVNVPFSLPLSTSQKCFSLSNSLILLMIECVVCDWIGTVWVNIFSVPAMRCSINNIYLCWFIASVMSVLRLSSSPPPSILTSELKNWRSG